MLEIFFRDRHPEVEGDDITVVVSAVRKETTAITMLITNVEGRSFILLFVRHLSRMP